MKKGFTLIELLAVIVILAIIALIATPIVLNIIKDSKESAGLRSAEMYLDAVEQTVSIEKMNNTGFNPSACTIKEDGILNCEGTNVQVEVKGEKPLKGNIVFESGKITNIRLEYKNNKIILKNEKGNLEYFDYDRNSDINFIVEGITEQPTTSGTNLFDEIIREADGLYQLDGSWSANANYDIYYLYKVKDSNQYRFSYNIGGIRTFWDADGNYLSSASVIDTVPMTFPEGAVLCKFAMHKQWRGGSEQIALGTTLPPYEPFTNGPSPNPTHPQEIPLAGTLNTKTGKYDIGVTASIEGGKSQTLTLTSPVKLTKWDKLVKRDGVWGWSFWSEKYILSASKISNVTYRGSTSCVLDFKVPNAKHLGAVVSNRVIRGNINTNADVNHTRIYNGALQVRLAYPEGVGIDNTNLEIANAFKPLFEENEYVFFYPTAEEQAFIPLPDEEQTLLYKLKL